MLDLDLTIYNYRCFSDRLPARISIRRGNTALIGLNNAGKSTLLRFFYEFRNLFAHLGAYLEGNLNGAAKAFGQLQGVRDNAEVFCNLNNRNIRIEIEWVDAGGAKHLVSIEVTRSLGWTATMSNPVDLKELGESLLQLSRTLYVGAFRNAINQGGLENYYDIQIGGNFVTGWRRQKL